VKDHLTTRGVDFIGINIVDDDDALDELNQLGAMALPVVSVGNKFAIGLNMQQVFELIGLDEDPPELMAAGHLVERIEQIVVAAVRYGGQLPVSHHDQTIPGRDRTYLGLTNHIVRHVEKFLGFALGAHVAPGGTDPVVLRGHERRVDPPSRLPARADLAFSELRAWFAEASAGELDRIVETSFGKQTLHSLLASCAFSVAQHTRQLMAVLDMLEIDPDGPLTDGHYEGLPMPTGVWE
jgi:hypothetical protein